MKKYILSITMVCLSQPWQIFADTVRLDRTVSISDDNGSIIRAFQSDANCAVWNYVPGRYLIKGSFMHSVRAGTAKFGEQNLSTYISGMQMQTLPSNSAENIKSLRSAIFQKVKSDGGCPQVQNEANLSISPATVKRTSVLGDKNDLAQANEAFLFSKIGPSHASTRAAEFDPSSPESLTYILDATNPDTVQYLRDLQVESQQKAVKLGNIGFVIQGVTGRVDSHLRLKAQLDLNFVSRLENIGCTTSDMRESLFGAGFIAPGGAAAGLLQHDKKVTNCTFQLREHFMGGEFREMFELDHRNSQLDIDGKPIMYDLCNEKDGCNDRVTLAYFVEFRLFYEFLMSNADKIMAIVANRATQSDPGRTGEVKTKFDIDIAYMRNFRGNYSLDVPVYAYQLDAKSFAFHAFEKPRAQCLSSKYDKQSREYNVYLSAQPLPAAEGCD